MSQCFWVRDGVVLSSDIPRGIQTIVHVALRYGTHVREWVYGPRWG